MTRRLSRVKRLLFFAFFLLLSFGTLAREITMWTWYGGVLGNIFSEIIREDFTTKTGIEVQIRTVPEDDSHFNNFLLAYIGGAPPDIVEIYSHHAGELGMRQALTDLSTISDCETVFRRITPKLLESVKFGRGVFAIPSEVNWGQMYYRQDILQNLGVEAPKTWLELGQVNTKLRASGKNSYYEFQGDNQAAYLYYPLVWQRGIDIYNYEGDASNLGAKEAETAFIELTELYTKYGLVLETPILTTFPSGEIPICILQNWHYSVIERTAPHIAGKWAIAEIPGSINKEGIFDHTNTGKLLTWGIPESSKNKKEAWELIKFLSSKDFLIKFMNKVYQSPEKWRLVFSSHEVLSSVPFPEDIKPILDACLNNCKLKKVVPGGYITDRYVAFAFNKVVLGNEDPKKALKDAAAESTREIQKKIKEFARFLNKLK